MKTFTEHKFVAQKLGLLAAWWLKMQTQLATRILNKTPLIWTTKGNVPVTALEWRYAWEETDEYIKYIDTYLLNGEVVKQSVAVHMKKGLAIGATQARF